MQSQHHQSPSFERNTQPSEVAEGAQRRLQIIHQGAVYAARGLQFQYGAELTAPAATTEPVAEQPAAPAIANSQNPFYMAVDSEQTDADVTLDADNVRSIIDRIHAEIMYEDGRDVA